MHRLKNRWNFSVESDIYTGYTVWAQDLQHGDKYEFFMHFRSKKEAEHYMPLITEPWNFDLDPNEWHLRSWKAH